MIIGAATEVQRNSGHPRAARAAFQQAIDSGHPKQASAAEQALRQLDQQ
jgi:hypothetical protein